LLPVARRSLLENDHTRSDNVLPSAPANRPRPATQAAQSSTPLRTSPLAHPPALSPAGPLTRSSRGSTSSTPPLPRPRCLQLAILHCWTPGAGAPREPRAADRTVHTGNSRSTAQAAGARSGSGRRPRVQTRGHRPLAAARGYRRSQSTEHRALPALCSAESRQQRQRLRCTGRRRPGRQCAGLGAGRAAIHGTDTGTHRATEHRARQRRRVAARRVAARAHLKS
jgi:hypothetical protein